jgi:hypothetical protein
MRGLSILLIAAAFAAGASAQPVADEKPRFGVTPNYDLYPQNTPKAALETAIKLLENKRYDYFLAHVVDPDGLQARMADRAARLEPEVEKQLLRKRDEQKRAPELVSARDKLPVEPKDFAAVVSAEAANRSFRYIVEDLKAQLAEYPENIGVFRKFLVEGQVADAGASASFTHKDSPGRSVYLKNNGKRWYLEDRQSDEPKPMLGK